jgi:hypothetical protein
MIMVIIITDTSPARALSVIIGSTKLNGRGVKRSPLKRESQIAHDCKHRSFLNELKHLFSIANHVRTSM